MDLANLAAVPVDLSIARGAAKLRAGGPDAIDRHARGIGYSPEHHHRHGLAAFAHEVIRQERAKAHSGHWAFSACRLMAAHELAQALKEPLP